MKLFNSIVSWVFKKRISQVEQFIKHPHSTQRNVFNKLIETAQHTSFGKEHGFGSISSISDFQNQVPIRNYEQTFPYIDRLIKGEQNVLWPSKISWFAKSSGTTSGKSKFIPVSKETLDDCHFKGGKDVIALYFHNNPESQFFAGKSLIMGGSHEVNEFNRKAKCGDVSAVMMQNMPLLGHFIQTPGLKAALLDDWEEKLEVMANKTISQNVTNLAGVPTWTLILLKRLLEIKKVDNIAEVWPNIELYVHGGVNFEPYRKQFESIIQSPKMQYYQAYNASEGLFAMQDQNNVRDMLLMLDYGIYYEFIPREEFDREYPKAIPLSEVQVGQSYAIVISTNSGLWRYKVGDTVTFTSTSPYRIKVTGRTKSFINAFGEEVIVENADQAIANACKKTNAIMKDYTAAPLYFGENNQGAHEWIISFQKKPDNESYFVEVLDQTLQMVNTDYQAKRQKDIALSGPIVHFTDDDVFTKWLKEKGKLGGQNKVPRLKNNRSILDEIKEYL